MRIGTVRAEEARVFDSMAGYHKFHAEETQEAYGSFEVFWDDSDVSKWGGEARNYDADGEPVKAGWYWWACLPGCMPDGEAKGPFASSRQAHQDADGWSPEYDEEKANEEACDE